MLIDEEDKTVFIVKEIIFSEDLAWFIEHRYTLYAKGHRALYNICPILFCNDLSMERQ